MKIRNIFKVKISKCFRSRNLKKLSKDEARKKLSKIIKYQNFGQESQTHKHEHTQTNT